MKASRRFGRFGLSLLLAAMFTLLLAAPVLAQAETPPVPSEVGLESILGQYLGLAGMAAVIALVINVLKAIGVIQEGTAKTWSAGLNLAGLILIFVFRTFVPNTDIAALDAQLGQFAAVGVVVFGYILQLFSSAATHAAVRGVPLIGYSHSLEAARRQVLTEPK